MGLNGKHAVDARTSIDAAQDEVLDRVAAIDVGKDSGVVCVRTPARTGSGRRVNKVWTVMSRTGAITELADVLVDGRIERVIMEATSDYWRPFFYLLEARGVTVWLVNARDVKNVPGRPKTDVLDAVWLAKLNERGMVRPSFVPPAPIRRLRDYTRMRSDLTGDRARCVQRLEKLLEDALIKLSAVVTDIMGVSGRMILKALIDGQRDPHILASMAKGSLRHKHAALVEALTGRFDDHHAELAAMLLTQADHLAEQIGLLDVRIEALIADLSGGGPPPDDPAGPGRPPPPALSIVDRLDEIPGIGRRTAQVIIAEIGPDMAAFPTPGHLVSWAKLAPRTIQSGAMRRSGRIGHGNSYLRSVLGEAAIAAARTNTFLGARYRRLVKRIGKAKALVAVARSILVIIWHLLADPTTRFHDLGPNYFDQHTDTERRTRNHVKQLETLGYTVTLTPNAA